MSAFLELDDVHKYFGDNEVLRGVEPERRRAPGRVPDRPVGLREVDTAPLRQRAGDDPAGRDPARRRAGLGPRRRPRTACARTSGIVFQSFNLFPHMSVLENVTLAPTKVLKLSKAEAVDRGACAARPDRHVGEARRLPRSALGWAAATGRDRARRSRCSRG